MEYVRPEVRVNAIFRQWIHEAIFVGIASDTDLGQLFVKAIQDAEAAMKERCAAEAEGYAARCMHDEHAVAARELAGHFRKLETP